MYGSVSISALQEGHVDSAICIINVLQNCPADVKAMNLRALTHSGLQRAIFGKVGAQILQWVDEKKTGLTSEEDLCLMAKIMKYQGNTEWYDSSNEGELFAVEIV